MTKDFCFFHPRGSNLGPVKSTLNKRSLKVIVEAISASWDEIDTYSYLKSKRFDKMDYNNERELTTKLAEILNDKLNNNSLPNFKKEIFQTVVRDGKQSTNSLDTTEKMPDLTFRMIRCMPSEDRDESALFVETKLVSEASGCREYVISGLLRFISGDYAPQVTFGMMLAYSSCSHNAPDLHLQNYFDSASSGEALLCAALVEKGNIAQDCFESNHIRPLHHAKDFKTLHLWLPRPIV